MANWICTVKFKDFWRSDLTFTERRDLAVKRIKESGWRDITPYPDHLDSLVDELAETLNIPEFDWALTDLYDQADEDLVWIETF